MVWLLCVLCLCVSMLLFGFVLRDVVLFACFVCESLCDDVWLVFLWCVCVFLRMY